MKMTNFCKGNFVGTLLLAFLAITSNLWAAPPSSGNRPLKTEKSEDQLIQVLAASNPENVITDAMTQLEKLFKKDASRTNAIPAFKKLLTDTRAPVRRKAARLLGIFHATLDDTEIKQLCEQLKSSDWREVQSGLKALRDLNAPAAVPEIVPCLKHANPFVTRDACRTLAAVGNKDVIPSIEPLLNDPNKAVQKDAQDAITALRSKL
jgi:HEAT repeat protein